MHAQKNTSVYSLKYDRKFKVFLLCLILTSIIWLLVELSKNYTSSAVFKVTYSNLPENKLLEELPVNQVLATLKAPGFNIIKYKFKKHKINFDLTNFNYANDRYFLIPNSQISELNDQLAGVDEITGIVTDTIFFELGNKVSKKVPVRAALEISFNLGYGLTKDLELLPDSVVISGPERHIDSITEVQTEAVTLDNVSQNIALDLSIDMATHADLLEISHGSIKLSGEVDKFTEGVFKVPVVIINKPENLTINPFPKEVDLVYKAGLANFNMITSEHIEVVFDFNQYKNDTLTTFLTPVIQHQSPLISSLKIVPGEIEFLIEK